MKKAGEEIIIWFSESQLPRAREKRALVHFLLALFMKKKTSQISDLEERIPF